MERGHLSDFDTGDGGARAFAAWDGEPDAFDAAPSPPSSDTPDGAPGAALAPAVPTAPAIPIAPAADHRPAPAVPAVRPGRRARAAAELDGWWRAAPDNLRGSVYMVAAFVVFAVMTASIKAIGPRLPLSEILFLRQIVMSVLLLPLFMSDWSAALRTDRMDLQILRGLLSLGSMLAGFTAIQYIPLADATALGFSQVLFVTVAAVLVLKETVGWRRWAATLIGFVGVLIMLRPGSGGGLDTYALFSVLGAAFSCGVTVTVRMLARSEKTATILLYQAIVLCAALCVPTVLWWVPPTPGEWALLLLIGFVGTAGQYLITKAYQVGEAAALAPLDFIRLLIATAIGFAVFAEVPSWTTVIGAVIVIGSTVYTVRSNARSGRAVPADPDHPNRP